MRIYDGYEVNLENPGFEQSLSGWGKPMAKKVSTQQALEQIGGVYVRFMKHPKKRIHILRHMIRLTNIIVNDPKVLPGVKQRAKDNLEKYRRML